MNKRTSESEIIEYKQSFAEKENAGEDLCAFANKRGGTLYFGVKNDGSIIGLQDVTEKSLRDLTQLYFDNFEPKIFFSAEVEDRNGQDVVKITVEKSAQPFHTYKGTPFIRIGPTTRKMSQDEYQRRLIYYKSTNKDYSSTIIPNAKITDLSIEALNELRNLLRQSGRYSVDISKLSDKQLLKDLLLIQNNQLTLASLVLLGKPESLAVHLPHSEIRYGYRLDEKELRNQDTEIFNGGYLLYYKKIWEKINSRNITLNIPYGMRLIEKKAFDEQTIREAINNAIVHRDYTVAASVFVLQYSSKITIKSPGGFPEGITIENIIDETKPRNKLVADILFKCELVEQFGNGVNLMYKNQLSLGKYPPNYSNSDENNVQLELDGKIQDIEFALYVLKIADEKDRELDDRELIVLNRIKNRQKVNSNQITDNLLELGLIERISYGKYMLSKQYYSDTNQTWVYTKRRGLSKNTYKELILEHIRNFDFGHKQDFLNVLNTLSEKQVESLLAELKKEEKIYFDGKPRSRTGVWRLKN